MASAAHESKLLDGKYRLESRLGEGAFGVVYRAYDQALTRPVAVKELRRDRPGMTPERFAEYADRFRREAQVQAQFNHPHIVHVYDLVDEGATLYLVMELVEGRSLQEALAAPGPLPVDRAVRITLSLLDALSAVHAHPLDIVHRDIKPSNVLLDRDGHAKLTDFGLAQVGGESSRSHLGGGAHPGSPLYMSPEQAQGVDYLRATSDLYSVGCVLFELLTGTAYKRADAGVAALRELRPEAPPALGVVLTKALETEARARYRRAADFAAALRAAMESPVVRAYRLAPGVEMVFVPIPAGAFLMGSAPQQDPAAEPDEQPQHSVFVGAYGMAKHPVTTAQFRAFVEATGYRTRAEHRGWSVCDEGDGARRVTGAAWQHPQGPGSYAQDDHPVVHIAWEDAKAFCAWASRVVSAPVRLPTEAEWERAARGDDGRRYPWGDAPPGASRCTIGPGAQGTTAVGAHSPQGDSPYGCADMAGNVWEWCADWYAADAYGTAPGQNPGGPDHGAFRVVRGGAWPNGVAFARAALRLWQPPEEPHALVGFRCVMTLPA